MQDHSQDDVQQAEAYKRIEKAIQFIETNFKSQPTLGEISASVHFSKFHFDRIFKQWAGVSPMQFQQFMTLEYTKQKLRESKSLLETSLKAGLSGASRLHDLFISFEAMTPGEFKKQGRGLTINYGFHVTPFGECLLAVTDRGICHLGFVIQENRSQALDLLFDTWPGAVFTEKPDATRPIAARIFKYNSPKKSGPFHLHLRGTNFQMNVWKALLNIPEGWVASYQDVAACMGNPKAVRAVASAIAVNPVAFLIPCHRVIAKTGKFHGYRWGSARKKAIIGWEAAKRAGTDPAGP